MKSSSQNFHAPLSLQHDLPLDKDNEFKNLENFKNYLETILRSGKIVVPEEIKYIFFNKSWEDSGIEGQNLMTLAEVYISRVKILQRIARHQEKIDPVQQNKVRGDLTVVSSNLFRTFVREGNNIKMALERRAMKNEKFNEAHLWIENFSKKLEDKIKKISAFSSREMLERKPRITFGFLDLSTDLDERIALLNNRNQSSLHFRPLPQYLEFKQPFSQTSNIVPKTDDLSLKENKMRPLSHVENPCPPRENNNNSDVELSPIIRSSEKKVFKSIENSPLDIQAVKQQTPKRNRDLDKTNEAPFSTIGEINSKRSLAMVTIREIIQYNNSDVPFDNITAVNCAQQIVEDFPSLNKSKEKLDVFCNFLKLLIDKHPCTYKELATKNFPASMLSELLDKPTSELAAIEKKYSDEMIRKKYEIALTTKGGCTNEFNDKRITKKKKKKNQGMKTTTLLKESMPTVLKQIQQADVPLSSKVENLLKTFGIEESKLLNTSKVNEDLLRSKLIHFRPTHGKRFSPLSDQSKEDDIMNLEKKEEKVGRGTSDFFVNDYDDEEERFSKSGHDDYSKNFGSNSKERSTMMTPLHRDHDQKKKNRTPILYDPDAENDLYQSTLMSNLPDPRRINKVEAASADCAIQIFDGMLQGLDHYCAPKIGLFTCGPLETVKLIPRIMAKKDRSLKIKGSAAYAKIESYINKAVNMVKKKEQYIISGWVESYVPICQDMCERMASNLLFNNRVGIYKYADCVKIFFMHQKQFRPEWLQKFLFTKKNLQKVSYSSLYFLLMFQPYKFSSNLSLLKKIKPEIIIPYKENNPSVTNQAEDENPIQNKAQDNASERCVSDQYSIDISPISGSYSPLLTRDTPKKVQKTPMSDSKGPYFITKYVS